MIRKLLKSVRQYAKHSILSLVFIIGEDPTYQIIENGAWLDNTQPYGTIHRIASNGQTQGVFNMVLDWCTAHCSNIRIDTHEKNIPMQRCLAKNGFVRCGVIYLEDGDPRIAYQRSKLWSKN